MMKYTIPFIILLLFACAKESELPVFPEETEEIEKNPEPEETPEPSDLSYLALGDSYTIGQSVAYSLNYPNQLYERLIADGIVINSPKIIAQTGWSTGQLGNAIKQESLDSNYLLVSLSIGVNNQFRGYDITAYEADFETLLKQAIAFAGGDNKRVFVLSIPDYGYTPFGKNRDQALITKELDNYNAINKRISENYEVAYFDITPISREGLMRTDLVASDGLHPSAKQYGEWVDLMYKEVKEEMLLK